MSKIFITASEKQILQNILKGTYEVYVFGSRVKGTHRKFSDLDICLKGDNKISPSEIFQIRSALSDSNLPFKVDLLDYQQLSEEFKALIDADGVELNEAEIV